MWWEGKPRYTRVSAVLFLDNLDPWSIRRTPALMLHNPWAQHPLPSQLIGVPEWIFPFEGRREVITGAPLLALLGLPDGWPIGEDDVVDAE